jgi:hypothetical protein
LQVTLQLAHLVEEQGRAAGLFEQAHPARIGAGEGALLVAEELRLQDGLGQRCHVDRVERPIPSRAARVQGAGHEFLARATLAIDQHRRVRGGDLLHDAEHGLHRAVRADHVLDPKAAAQLFAQARVLVQQSRALEGARQCQQQDLAIEGFGQIVEGTLAHGFHRRANAAVGGHEHDTGARLLALDFLQERHARQVGHLEIGEHHVERLPAQGSHGQPSAAGGHHVVALGAQDQPQDLQLGRLVIHDQQVGFHGRESGCGAACGWSGSRTGSRTRTRVPWPGALSNSITPAWPSTMRRTETSPRPTPVSFVEK